MKYYSLLCKVALLMMTAGWLHAQESLVSPVTRTLALTNANIVQKPGQVIEKGTIVIKDGLILAVGKEVKIPVGARVIAADSMYVYAGFIDGLSHTGVPRPDNTQAQRGQAPRPQQAQQVNRSNPTNEQSGITPEQQVKDQLKADDKSIEEMRKAGFTAAHVVPRGNMLPGTGAVVLLKGSSADAMVMRNETALFSQLAGAGRVYPSTVIAVMSKWRELYKRAEQAKAHEAMYAKNPTGMARPNYDRSLQAFYPVIDKKMPVFFAASDLKSIHRALTLQDELKFPMVLTNVKQGWEVANVLKSKNIPVLVALDLPKEKKQPEKKEGDKDAAKKEKSITEQEMEILEKRSAEELQRYLAQSGVFEKAGIEFAFSAMTVKSTDVQSNLRKMIANGLSENTALAALTTTPAKMLGVANGMGTVEKGKLANLVITDKPYFAEKSNVRYVMIEGQLFEYEVVTRKAGDPNANAKPAGIWSYTINVPGQTTEGRLEIVDSNGSLSGTISNSQTNQETPISNAEIKGNALTFSANINMGGQSLVLDYELLIDGNNMEGTVSVGQFGTFRVEGSRNPGKN